MESKELVKLFDRIQNAKYLTSNLLTKTQDFAGYLASEMESLGVDSLMSGKYQLKTLRTSVAEDTSLYLRTGEDLGYDMLYVCLDVSKISAQREVAYLYGDFNAGYYRPNRSDIFEFSGDARALLTELASLEKMPEPVELVRVSSAKP